VRILQTPQEVLELVFSPDGRTLAAAVAHHGIFCWTLDSASPMPVRIPFGSNHRKWGLHFSADSRSLSWLVPGGRRTFHRDTRQTVEESFAVTPITYGLTVSASGNRILSQHGLPDHCLIGWRLAETGWVRTWRLSTLDLSMVNLTLTPDGRWFALFSYSTSPLQFWQLWSQRLELRDAETAQLLGEGEYPYTYACPLLFSPDGGQLVGFNHRTLLVWSVTDTHSLGQPRLVLNDNRKHYTACAYHPSGRYLYVTSNDATVQVFDTTTWDRVQRFTWQLGRLRTVTVSPDGTLAAAGNNTGQIVVWDLD
jgi:WD40 repeat protein